MSDIISVTSSASQRKVHFVASAVNLRIRWPQTLLVIALASTNIYWLASDSPASGIATTTSSFSVIESNRSNSLDRDIHYGRRNSTTTTPWTLDPSDEDRAQVRFVPFPHKALGTYDGGEATPQAARNSAGKCTNGPYIFDQNSHLEGVGSTFQHRKYSLILAAALNASWIGTLHNKHTYDKRAKDGENYAHSYFGLGDPDCSPEDLQARAAELDIVHFRRPKDSKGEYFAATEGGHRFPSFKSLCRSVETGTLPTPWMTSNTVVAMKYKSRPRESYNYCLFNRHFRSQFEARQRERRVRTRGRDELWIGVHFRWGDVAKWSKSVESPNKRAGAGLSEYINEARIQVSNQRGHNKTTIVHFFSEGNATMFSKFLASFPDAEMHINEDWRESLDVMTQSNVLIGGQSGFFLLAAGLCGGCSTVVTASPSNKKFRASSVEKNLTSYRPVIGFSAGKNSDASLLDHEGKSGGHGYNHKCTHRNDGTSGGVFDNFTLCFSARKIRGKYFIHPVERPTSASRAGALSALGEDLPLLERSL